MVAYVIDGTQESLVTLRGLPRSLRAELLPHRFTARTSRRKCSSSTVRSNAFLPGTSVNQDSSQVRIGSATLPNCPLFNAQQGSRTEPYHLGSGALLTHLACDLIRAILHINCYVCSLWNDLEDRDTSIFLQFQNSKR